MSNPTPSLHRPISMGTRVIVPESFLGKKNVIGTVSGVASCFLIFHYIVVLDEEQSSMYGNIKAVSVPGTELVGENGENWKISDYEFI